MTSNKVPAVITYQKPGARPPIFVAGTFSDPSWQPHEMDYEVQGDGELLFKKEFEGEFGSEVQYKFRIGEGDWWDLQQSQRTVTDSAGNTNHVMEIGSSSAPTTLSPTNGEVSTNEQDQKQEEPEEQAASNPVKPNAPRVQALMEEEIPTGSGTSTPVFAKVAAEVADSAELLHEDVPDREPAQGSIQVQSSSKPIKPSDSQLQSIMNEEIRTGSGTGTPVTARVAAEVADSAALLNEDVPDRVSFDSGVRELEPTPVTDDATTAAEVADTAGTLDRVDEILLSSPPLDDVQPFTPSDEPDNYLDHKPPLFAHELAGVSSPESELRELDPEDEHLHADKSPIEDIDPDDVDLNDPTLERFPSNREEIIDTVRKLETSLNEDQASFEGAPPSPVMNSPSNGVQDVTDYILADNTPTPAVSRQPSKHLDVPKSPHSSAGSPLSLQSITEAEEPEEPVVEDDSATQPAVVSTNTDLKPRPSPLELDDGIEDAGVASKDSVSPRTAISATKIVTPEGSPMTRQAELVSESRTSSSSQSPEVNETGSGVQSLQDKQTAAAPATPVPNQFDDASRAGKDSLPAQESETGEGSAEASSVVTPAIQSEAANSATATGAEVNGELQQARKRATQQAEEVPRATNPISTRPTGGVQPEQGGNWLHAFFRVLFVDWIGGFISKICGTSRRNTT